MRVPESSFFLKFGQKEATEMKENYEKERIICAE